tara:strand:- start:274 stop:489 length:216 start_codon:yes stop_codon:yes gene_type:complete
MEHWEFSDKHRGKHDIELSLPYDLAIDGVIEMTCRHCDLYVILNIWQDNDGVVIEDEGDCWVDEEAAEDEE